jgi:hypothetical protein
MCLLETFTHPLQTLDKPTHLTLLADAFIAITDSYKDALFLLVHFINKIQPRSDILLVEQLVQKHCPDLYASLKENSVDLRRLCSGWFKSFFAGVLQVHTLEGLWDIVIGGAPDVLDYVALCLLVSVKRMLLGADAETWYSTCDNVFTINQINKYIDSEKVSQMAVELWETPVIEKMSVDTRESLGV